MDNATLAEALRAAGHNEAADALRDGELAKQLRDAGHEDAAALIEAKRTAPAEPSPEPKPKTLEQAHGDAVIHAIARDTKRDFTPEAA